MSILVIFGQTTKAIALLFGQKWLIFITFQCSITINQFQVWSFVGKTPRLKPYFLPTNGSFLELFNVQSNSINVNCGHFWAKYQGYSLTFWPKLPHFHDFNLQSKSITFNCGHLCANYQGYSLTFWPKMPHFHHFSMFNQTQSISILVIFGQPTKAIALLFGQTWLIFITFQCSIKINQFQVWSFVGKTPRLKPYFLPTNGSFLELFNVQSKSINFNCGHFWAKYQGYSLTFWPKMPHFHHFNLQSNSITFKFGHLCAKYQGYSLTFRPNMPQFHHFNLQSKSITFTFGHLCAKYHGYSLTFRPNMADFHHFSMFNQYQSISFLVIFGQNTKAIALLFGQKCLSFITSICNHNQSLSRLVICVQNTKDIALLFGQTWLIFITFQCSININQFQLWSFLGKIPWL